MTKYIWNITCTLPVILSRPHCSTNRSYISLYHYNHIAETFLQLYILHYSDVIMDMMASQITSLTIVYSTVYSDADQRKHQSSALLAFVRGIHRWPVNSPTQMTSNAENVYIWWRHHVIWTPHLLHFVFIRCIYIPARPCFMKAYYPTAIHRPQRTTMGLRQYSPLVPFVGSSCKGLGVAYFVLDQRLVSI